MRGKSRKKWKFTIFSFLSSGDFLMIQCIPVQYNHWKYIQSSSIKFMVPPWSIVGGGRVPIGLWNEQDKATCSGCESELWCRLVMMIVLPKMRGHELVTTFLKQATNGNLPFDDAWILSNRCTSRKNTFQNNIFCRCGHWKRQSVRLESSWWWIFRNETCWVMTFLESANER